MRGLVKADVKVTFPLGSQEEDLGSFTSHMSNVKRHRESHKVQLLLKAQNSKIQSITREDLIGSSFNVYFYSASSSDT